MYGRLQRWCNLSVHKPMNRLFILGGGDTCFFQRLPFVTVPSCFLLCANYLPVWPLVGQLCHRITQISPLLRERHWSESFDWPMLSHLLLLTFFGSSCTKSAFTAFKSDENTSELSFPRVWFLLLSYV